MDRDAAGYEPFFGLVERPFSLTPDPKYYYRSRSHGSAFDALAAGIARRDALLLVSGDLGVGKTTLCRTLIETVSRRLPVAMVGNPIVSPEDLLRLLLQDFGVVSKDEMRHGVLYGVSRADLRQRFDAFLVDLRSSREGAVLIVDEAQSLPPATSDLVADLTRVAVQGQPALQVVLAAQAPASGAPALTPSIDERLVTRVRLMPIDRDECAGYLAHRLTIAGGVTSVTFAARALEGIYGLSGGLPRLINLIAERALREAAAASTHRVEGSMVESAASALEILRLKPRRFRWFGSAEGSARGTL
jgi:type II secretory pathway predicted ATPase ExeA